MKSTGFEETISALYSRLDRLMHFKDLQVSADPPAAFFTITIYAPITKDIAEVRDELKAAIEQWIDADCKEGQGYIVSAEDECSVIELKEFISDSSESTYQAEFVAFLTYRLINPDHSHPESETP